ncbi:MAG: response regulator [Steroidobacteraceae bacterium]|jgi:signal transduction histidine kinase/DNA-binding response OmpR family regulator/HPt (histidine-containing phosphotransfer) domain-containing protein
MMRWLGQLSLAFRLRAMILGAVAVTLLLGSLLYTVMTALTLRRNATEHVLTLVYAVGANATAALKSSDRGLARRTLQALRAERDIRAATLYDSAGLMMADVSFVADNPPAPRQLPARDIPRSDGQGAAAAPSIEFQGLTRAHIRAPIVLDGMPQGTIVADAYLTQFEEPWKDSLQPMAFGLLFAGLVAYALSSRMRRAIAVPLADLFQVARNVRQSKDFSIRVEKQEDDEFGALIDGFNEMLGELERRDRNLHVYQNELDKRVRERTTELDLAVAEARAAAQRAEGASRAKSDFLARMSHEIRTPMNGVLGMAELLRQSPTLDERQRRYAITIHQSGTALLDIINDILDFSKIEAGKLELEKAPFCLRDIVEDAVDILAERAHSKGLELICAIPAELDTTVCGDGPRLRQVIINLISNAVKFTERGEITVHVRHEPADLLNSSFHFEVCDTGIGIKPENCETIFESFAQEDSSTTRQYGGTGLGLAICKQLVELTGGHIGVSSAPGKGSRFFFSVPLTPDSGAQRERRTTALTRSRMLIVDDNSTHRDILRQHLFSWGVVVSVASSGRQALEILDRSLGGEFDVIIVDAQMPEMSGAALIELIRGRPEFTSVPVVMMNSGLAWGSVAAKAQDGANAWLNKPIRRTQLRTCLMELLAEQYAAEDRLLQSGARSADLQPSSGPKSLQLRRLLLVEDNPVNQEVALAMLQSLGIEAVSAWSGEEALEKIAVERFDVVLMDCQMPKMDGYATTIRIRELEQAQQRARMPIVALTANALSGDADRCFAAGMDHYLSKPFTLEQLRAVLEPYAADIEPGAAGSDTGCVPEWPVTHESPPSNDHAVLDQQTLGRIRALHRPGGPDLLAKVVGIYLSSSLALTDVMRAAALDGDSAALVHAAHALKSSSANVGAIAFADLCREVEAAAAAGDMAEARTLVDRLLAQHRQVLQALDEQTMAA